jgi:hypothetical protein
MAIPPQNPFQFQHVNHPSTTASYQEPVMKATPPSTAKIDPTLANNINSSSGAKKQKTTPPCDRCRQRRVSYLVLSFFFLSNQAIELLMECAPTRSKQMTNDSSA